MRCGGIAGSLLQRRHQMLAGIAVKFLCHGEIIEQRFVMGAVIPSRCPGLGGFDQVTPIVGASARTIEELIDALLGGVGHDDLRE